MGAPSPCQPASQARFSDAYLDAWGEVFVKYELHRHLGLRFDAFIQAPYDYLHGQSFQHTLRRTNDGYFNHA